MTRQQAILRAATAAVAVLLVSGCWRRAPTSAQTRLSRVTIEVSNHHWSTVVVYAVVNDQRMRMGEVNTGSTTSLVTPPGLDPGVVDFGLVVDPIGSSETYRTGTLNVRGGNRILLTVENDIRNSSYRIR